MIEPNFFQMLLDHSPDSVFVLNQKGYYVYVNNVWARTLKTTKNLLTGKHISEGNFFSRQSLENFDSKLPLIFSGKITNLIQMDLQMDSLLHFQMNYSVIKTDSNEKYIQCVLRDITYQAQREKQHNLLAEALDYTRVGVLITDPNQIDNPIIYVNKGFQKMTGYKEAEVIGENCRFLQGPDTNPKDVAMIREAMAKESEIEVEILNYKKDKSPFWNELSINPVKHNSDKVEYFVGVQHDITKRRLLELELQKDLKLSTHLQQAMLSKTLTEDNISIQGCYRPYHQIGGDFYKWKEIEDGLYAVILLDVMGHGINASLITMSLNAEIIALLRANERDPATILTNLNDHLFEILPKDKDIPRTYFTCIYLLIDTNGRQIHYTNAGHPNFLLKSETGVTKFPSNNIPVGAIEGHTFTFETFRYEPTSELFLYTDGLLDHFQKPSDQLEESYKDTDLYEHYSQQVITDACDDITFLKITL